MTVRISKAKTIMIGFTLPTALAKRSCTEEEKKNNSNEKARVLIEVKAKGGYVVVHPKMGYRFIQHDLKSIPLIVPAERQLLYTVASSFNEYIEPDPIRIYPSIHIYDPESRFDDYNLRGDIIGLLQRHGWKVVRDRSTAVKSFFRRPGKPSMIHRATITIN